MSSHHRKLVSRVALWVTAWACLAAGRAEPAAGAEHPSVFDRKGFAELEAIMKGRAGPQAPGIAVARIGLFGRIETVAAGCAQFDEDGTSCRAPLTQDSVMRVASISKLVATFGLMHLAARSAISRDHDVSEYLGFKLRNPAFPDVPITVRSLLAHTSSVRDGDTYWAVPPQTLAEYLSSPQYFDSTHPPGTFFSYSNLNFGIVGTLVECVTRERFDRYMRHALFAPLDMQAGYNWSGLENLPPERVTTLYRKQDTSGAWNEAGPWIAQVDDFKQRSPSPQVRGAQGFGPPPADYQPCTNGTLFAPQGGLRISIRDLARLVRGAMKDGTIERLAQPAWRLNEAGDNGDTLNGLYRAYGPGMQLEILGADLVGHLADAYGLKGGVLIDLKRKRAWIYLITGTSRAPELAPSPYSGFDTLEAAVLQSLGLPEAAQPIPEPYRRQ